MTTAAHAIVKSVHNRMPVILAEDCYDDWLTPQIQSAKEAIALLQRTEPKPMLLTEVRSLVNNPRNDVQECIEPLITGTDREPEGDR